MLQVNDKYLPYLDCKVRYLHLWGGSGSGKSVFAAQKLIARLKSEKPHRILCVRKVANTLRSSIYQLLIDQILEAGLYGEFSINKSEMRFTHVSGNELLLAGLDDVEKLKSIAGITGIWIEEATEIEQSDFDQLDLRLRGETANYKQIIFTYNPISERHWLKKRFHDQPNEDFATLRTTFMDNAFIDGEYRRVLESKAKADPNLYKIYYLGEWGVENKEGKFCWAFTPEQIVKTERVMDEILWVTFDFNINPMSAIVVQVFPEIKALRWMSLSE
jgi:phage terminase large subunit